MFFSLAFVLHQISIIVSLKNSYSGSTSFLSKNELAENVVTSKVLISHTNAHLNENERYPQNTQNGRKQVTVFPKNDELDENQRIFQNRFENNGAVFTKNIQNEENVGILQTSDGNNERLENNGPIFLNNRRDVLPQNTHLFKNNKFPEDPTTENERIPIRHFESNGRNVNTGAVLPENGLYYENGDVFGNIYENREDNNEYNRRSKNQRNKNNQIYTNNRRQENNVTVLPETTRFFENQPKNEDDLHKNGVLTRNSQLKPERITHFADSLPKINELINNCKIYEEENNFLLAKILGLKNIIMKLNSSLIENVVRNENEMETCKSVCVAQQSLLLRKNEFLSEVIANQTEKNGLLITENEIYYKNNSDLSEKINKYEEIIRNLNIDYDIMQKDLISAEHDIDDKNKSLKRCRKQKNTINKKFNSMEKHLYNGDYDDLNDFIQ